MWEMMLLILIFSNLYMIKILIGSWRMNSTFLKASMLLNSKELVTQFLCMLQIDMIQQHTLLKDVWLFSLTPTQERKILTCCWNIHRNTALSSSFSYHRKEHFVILCGLVCSSKLCVKNKITKSIQTQVM